MKKKTKVYKNWLAENGQPVIVELVSFEGVVKTTNKTTTRVYLKDGKKYVAEIWKDINGNKYIVKEEYNPDEHDYRDDNGEVGWSYTKRSDALFDDHTNPLIDDIKYFKNTDVPLYHNINYNEKTFPDRQIGQLEKNEKVYIKRLKKIKKEYPELKDTINLWITLRTKPDLRHARWWREGKIITSKREIDIRENKKKLFEILNS